MSRKNQSDTSLRFTTTKDRRLHFLLDKNGEGDLASEELIELEKLLKDYDDMSMARAMYPSREGIETLRSCGCA